MFDIIDGDLNRLLGLRRMERTTRVPGLPTKPVLIQSLAGQHTHLLVQKKEKYKGQDVLQVLMHAIQAVICRLCLSLTHVRGELALIPGR